MADLIPKLHQWLLQLDSLEPPPSNLPAADLFQQAASLHFQDHQQSLQLAQQGLTWLAENQPPRQTYRYLQGKLTLLIGLLTLHQAETPISTLEHLTDSRAAFRAYKWLQFEALTDLALCLTLQKLNRWAEAKHSATQGLGLIADAQLLTPREGDWLLDDVAHALQEQLHHIANHSPTATETNPAYNPSLEGGIPLTIFPASAGVAQSPGKRKSELDFLSRKAYQDATSQANETCYVNPDVEEAARQATYILEIDPALSSLDSQLQPGDWLFIQAKTSADDLNKKKVLLLEKQAETITASLKLFDEEEDHFFMESLTSEEDSILVKKVNTKNPAYLRQYYAEQYPNLLEKPVYPLWVIGEVIAHCPHSQTETLYQRYMWEIPIAKQLSAGLGWPLSQTEISGWHRWEATKPQQGNYFACQVEGNSMHNAGIKSGQLALIQHQAQAENEQIAAVVVDDLQSKQRYGFLKRYHFLDKVGLRHWFLKSEAPNAPHILVIDPESDPSEVLKNYQTLLDTDMLQVYNKALLQIVGIFIEILPEN